MKLKTPYLLFLGDAPDALAAKVAQGVKDWRPELALGQYRMPGCNADLGIRDLSIAEARAEGAETMVIGVANQGGFISESWVAVILEALDAGMDVAAGLHAKLSDLPAVQAKATALGRSLFDVRHPTDPLKVGKGTKRPGKRALPVGTDCSCGKMYTALALEREMKARGWKATFRATGQTGIFIAGEGVSVDAVVADFISGAVEALAPAADPDHWDLVEGQGSLFHPSFAGVTTGLIHGAQADALILCHEPTRTHMRGTPDFPIPDLEAALDLNLRVARLTNPAARFVGVSVNTKALDDSAATKFLDDTARRLNLPTVDPVRQGVGPIVDAMADI